MKIVVLEAAGPNTGGDCSWDAFDAEFKNVIYYDRSPKGTVAERIGDADIALGSLFTGMDKDVINACPNLKFISTLSTGYNYIDVEAAKARGIPVSNIPTYGPYTVAQHALALLLEICNRVGHHDQEVRKGRWNTANYWTFWDHPMIELAHKTFGVVGLGRIGKNAAKMAKGFGMNVIAYDEYQDDEGRSIGEYVDMDTLYARSDVISLHSPLFEATRGMINKNTIAKMKDGVILINTARGPLIVEEDLAAALHSGKVWAAGLDTTAVEPVPMDNPLLKAPNCFITPHNAWAPQESRQRIIEQAIINCRSFIEGKPINVVNK